MSGDEILLRPARAGDVPALVRLLRRSWLTIWAPELPFEAVRRLAAEDPATGYAQTMWKDFLVAVRQEQLIGMVHPHRDCVGALHVDPAEKGRGVGSRLLQAAEALIARDHGVARLEMLAFNPQARTFYARHGWQEVRSFASEESGAPVEAIEMRKVLHGRLS